MLGKSQGIEVESSLINKYSEFKTIGCLYWLLEAIANVGTTTCYNFLADLIISPSDEIEKVYANRALSFIRFSKNSLEGVRILKEKLSNVEVKNLRQKELQHWADNFK